MKKEKTTPATTEKPKRKRVDIVVNVVLICAVLLGIVVSYTAFTTETSDSTASFFGIMPFSIQSDSMSPTFEQGDLVLDKTVDAEDLEVGDIITFWTVINGERVRNTHRITEIQDMGTYLYFNTKGDNNSIEDSLGVHQSEIIGQYITHIPNVGSVIDFLQTGTGFLVVIVVPVFLFFVYNLIAFFRSLFAYQTEKMRMQLLAEHEAMQSERSAAPEPQVEAPKAEEAPETEAPPKE